eukprot:MONOS_2494.1-p1 / transcript=MONOS_2494.1 / gene=MONOS_2494 / organism=Monocercomonoides_exilis_PA203 / gene_product=unspecified product / transcript_product=unspecified product / location=Mono_scaffold00052:18143-23110(+) / protein_length=1656 / sequence_SO=supercontig / SO=protein_coding / is_pseudo=false
MNPNKIEQIIFSETINDAIPLDNSKFNEEKSNFDSYSSYVFIDSDAIREASNDCITESTPCHTLEDALYRRSQEGTTHFFVNRSVLVTTEASVSQSIISGNDSSVVKTTMKVPENINLQVSINNYGLLQSESSFKLQNLSMILPLSLPHKSVIHSSGNELIINGVTIGVSTSLAAKSLSSSQSSLDSLKESGLHLTNPSAYRNEQWPLLSFSICSVASGTLEAKEIVIDSISFSTCAFSIATEDNVAFRLCCFTDLCFEEDSFIDFDIHPSSAVSDDFSEIHENKQSTCMFESIQCVNVTNAGNVNPSFASLSDLPHFIHLFNCSFDHCFISPFLTSEGTSLYSSSSSSLIPQLSQEMQSPSLRVNLPSDFFPSKLLSSTPLLRQGSVLSLSNCNGEVEYCRFIGDIDQAAEVYVSLKNTKNAITSDSANLPPSSSFTPLHSSKSSFQSTPFKKKHSNTLSPTHIPTSLCGWNSSLVHISSLSSSPSMSASIHLKDVEFIRSTIGGLSVSGASVSLDRCMFVNNSLSAASAQFLQRSAAHKTLRKAEHNESSRNEISNQNENAYNSDSLLLMTQFPSWRKNIECDKNGVIDVISLKRGDGTLQNRLGDNEEKNELVMKKKRMFQNLKEAFIEKHKKIIKTDQYSKIEKTIQIQKFNERPNDDQYTPLWLSSSECSVRGIASKMDSPFAVPVLYEVTWVEKERGDIVWEDDGADRIIHELTFTGSLLIPCNISFQIISSCPVRAIRRKEMMDSLRSKPGKSGESDSSEQQNKNDMHSSSFSSSFSFNPILDKATISNSSLLNSKGAYLGQAKEEKQINLISNEKIDPFADIVTITDYNFSSIENETSAKGIIRTIHLNDALDEEVVYLRVLYFTGSVKEEEAKEGKGNEIRNENKMNNADEQQHIFQKINCSSFDSTSLCTSISSLYTSHYYYSSSSDQFNTNTSSSLGISSSSFSSQQSTDFPLSDSFRSLPLILLKNATFPADITRPTLPPLPTPISASVIALVVVSFVLLVVCIILFVCFIKKCRRMMRKKKREKEKNQMQKAFLAQSDAMDDASDRRTDRRCEEEEEEEREGEGGEDKEEGKDEGKKIKSEKKKESLLTHETEGHSTSMRNVHLIELEEIEENENQRQSKNEEQNTCESRPSEEVGFDSQSVQPETSESCNNDDDNDNDNSDDDDYDDDDDSDSLYSYFSESEESSDEEEAENELSDGKVEEKYLRQAILSRRLPITALNKAYEVMADETLSMEQNDDSSQKKKKKKKKKRRKQVSVGTSMRPELVSVAVSPIPIQEAEEENSNISQQESGALDPASVKRLALVLVLLKRRHKAISQRIREKEEERRKRTQRKLMRAKQRLLMINQAKKAEEEVKEEEKEGKISDADEDEEDEDSEDENEGRGEGEGDEISNQLFDDWMKDILGMELSEKIDQIANDHNSREKDDVSLADPLLSKPTTSDEEPNFTETKSPLLFNQIWLPSDSDVPGSTTDASISVSSSRASSSQSPLPSHWLDDILMMNDADSIRLSDEDALVSGKVDNEEEELIDIFDILNEGGKKSKADKFLRERKKKDFAIDTEKKEKPDATISESDGERRHSQDNLLNSVLLMDSAREHEEGTYLAFIEKSTDENVTGNENENENSDKINDWLHTLVGADLIIGSEN